MIDKYTPPVLTKVTLTIGDQSVELSPEFQASYIQYQWERCCGFLENDDIDRFRKWEKLYKAWSDIMEEVLMDTEGKLEANKKK